MSASTKIPVESKQRLPHRITQRWAEGVVLFFIVAYFIHFCRQALNVRFALDEMMNMYRHWEPGLWRLGLANFTFSNHVVRPMGALYYMPLFKIFGFNPLPFNVVRLAILAVNAFIFFRLAAYISESRRVAATATFVVAYHALIGNIVYVGSFIYDALCAGFYFSALLYYIRCRGLYGRLDLRRSCVFLGLYVFALNSKEMAVSLPVVLVAYELLYHSPKAWKPTAAPWRALTKAGPAPAVAIAITAIFIAVKTWGPGSLTNDPGFVPSYTLARFFETNIHYLNTIFYADWFSPKLVILAWAALLYVAARKWDQRLLLLWVWVVVTPLPIAFIPGRGGACLYIVAAGWALAIAILMEALGRQIAREPIFARIPSAVIVTCVMASGLALYAYQTQRLHQWAEAAYLRDGEKTANLIRQFQRLPVHPDPGSRVIFLNDPFPGFDTFFIASLWWNDHSLKMKLQNQVHLPLWEVYLMDYVFDFPDGQLKQVKP